MAVGQAFDVIRELVNLNIEFALSKDGTPVLKPASLITPDILQRIKRYPIVRECITALCQGFATWSGTYDKREIRKAVKIACLDVLEARACTKCYACEQWYSHYKGELQGMCVSKATVKGKHFDEYRKLVKTSNSTDTQLVFDL